MDLLEGLEVIVVFDSVIVLGMERKALTYIVRLDVLTLYGIWKKDRGRAAGKDT